MLTNITSIGELKHYSLDSLLITETKIWNNVLNKVSVHILLLFVLWVVYALHANFILSEIRS